MKKVSILSLIICCVLCMLIVTSCDSSKTTNEDSSDTIKEKLKSSQTGDIIQFGKDSDGKAINWVVYERAANRITAITVDFAATKPFDSHGNSDYMKSSLSVWANEDFYNDSFSEAEKALIATDNHKMSVFLAYGDEIKEMLTDDFINKEFRDSYTLSVDVCWTCGTFYGELYCPTKNSSLYYDDDDFYCKDFENDSNYEIRDDIDLDYYFTDTTVAPIAQKYVDKSAKDFYQYKAGVRLRIKINLGDPKEDKE